MEGLFLSMLAQIPTPFLFAVILGLIFFLAKGADILINEAVTLSLRMGISKVLIGATIVSLGTTLPEATVSVMAAISGSPDLALGNAVGSVICDTGLILGLAATMSPLSLDKKVIKIQGRFQFWTGILLVAATIPLSRIGEIFISGGNLPQWAGFIFLFLLIAYFIYTFKTNANVDHEEADKVAKEPLALTILKLAGGITLVILTSKFLIPTVQKTALRLHLPENIIAATLVAFGTSLPELITAITAVRKGHGELAIGNVIGADILNILFVSGLSASVTPGGLVAGPYFFRMLFPSMIILLLIFRIGFYTSRSHLRRPVGIILLSTYLAITIGSYSFLHN